MKFLLFISFLMNFSFIFASEIEIKKYLETDLLSSKLQEKDKFLKEGTLKKIKEVEKNFFYPSIEDFWKFSSEYWLVKNVNLIKWNKSSEFKNSENEFLDLLKRLKIGPIKIKVFIYPTTWLPHFSLYGGSDTYYFFISQQFIEKSKMKMSDLSFVMLEDLERMRQGYFFSFLQDDSFIKNLGKNFYSDKKANIGDFEKLMEKMTLFFRYRGYSFEEQYLVTKNVSSHLKNLKGTNFHKDYLSYLSRISDQTQELEQTFSRYEGLFPGSKMKPAWAK